MTVVQLLMRLEKLRAEGHGGADVKFYNNVIGEYQDVNSVEAGDDELGDPPVVRLEE